MRTLSFSLVVSAFLAAACGNAGGDGGGILLRAGGPAPGDPGGPAPVEVKVRLQPLASCDEVEATLRQGALDAMNKRLDLLLKNALTDDLTACRPNGFLGYYTDEREFSDAGDSADGPKQSSGTNNQVAGVDEADFVKNDGQYIYLLANGAFRVLDAWPPESASEIARVPVAGTPKKLFVVGDRALVYSSPDTTPGAGQGNDFGDYGPARECTYGYECQFSGDGRPTDLTVYDLSDRAAPRVVRTLRTDSSFVAARRVGDDVYTVLTSPGVEIKGVNYFPALEDRRCDDPSDPARLRAAVDGVRQQNVEAIAAASLAGALPTLSDGGATDLLAACAGFYRSSEPGEGDGFTTVLSLSLADDASPTHTSTIVSRPGATYASGEALYLAVPPAFWYYDFGFRGFVDGPSGEAPEPAEASVVHKFVFDRGEAAYAASGEVKGRVLNQFSLDERDGFLRVATTSGRLPDPKTHSTLSVLAQQGAALATVGTVDDIAPSEDIRSVRFDGDRGYVVTFKKTDPLFVFDLANPAAPRALGELKIPGFSTYMHRLDAGHLLTIGYDADDMGDFAYFDGVLLQIFDVRDPANPKLAHKEVIGTRGSSSEALTNHLAFTYFAEKGLLALPMSICEGGGDGQYGQFTFGGVLVYGVSAEGGFTPRGRVDVGRPTDEELDSYGYGLCSNWWTQASSAVKRIIFMDDFLYSVSDAAVKVNHVGNLAADVASVDVR
jgi:beta propeller domain-containing protein